MTQTQPTRLGRLALRAEGENWNAYYAMPDTMVGALFLGSIRLAFVRNPTRKQAFIDLMTSAVGAMLDGIVDARVDWLAQAAAPESERTRE